MLAAGLIGIMQAAWMSLPYVRAQFGEPIGRSTGAGQARRHVHHDERLAGLCPRGGEGLRPRQTTRGMPPARSSMPRRRPPMRAGCDPVAGGNGYINEYRPAACCVTQTLRDRRRHQRDPPHADRPRAIRQDGLSCARDRHGAIATSLILSAPPTKRATAMRFIRRSIRHPRIRPQRRGGDAGLA